MRFQVMCPHIMCPLSISNVVKRWTHRLKGKGNDKDHCDFMMRRFQCHVEDGLFHTPVTKIQEVDDRILQWRFILDRKRNELRNYFPSTNSAFAGAVPLQYTDTSTKSTGGNKTIDKSCNTRFPNHNYHNHRNP